MESLPASATNVTTRGLRYGGTQDIQNHYVNSGALSALVRGGWTLDEKETKNTPLTYSVGSKATQISRVF